MDFEQARLNMIEQQIRPWEVLDSHVLNMVAGIHREDFMPAEYRQLALADIRIPLMHGQVTLAPREEARILQSVAIGENDEILEVGTGCGYLTALLAKAGATVESIEIFPELSHQAQINLQRSGLDNIQLHTGDAAKGWQTSKSYDVIIITGAMPILEESFLAQLNPGGRLFVVVGQPPVMEARLITRAGEREWSREVLFETDLLPLIGSSGPAPFNF